MRFLLIFALMLSGAINAATPAQRYTSVMTGLLDAAPTAEQSTAVTNAFVAQASDELLLELFGAAHPGMTGAEVRTALTNAERVTLVVYTMRRDVRERVEMHGGALAEPSAQQVIRDARAAARAIIRTPDDPASAENVKE